MYRNGYISYRQALFTNLEKYTFFFNFSSQNKTIQYDNYNRNYNEMTLSKWSKSFWNFI